MSLRVNIESYASGGNSSTLWYDQSIGFGVNSAVGLTQLLDSSGNGTEMLIVTFSRDVTLSGHGMSDWTTGFGLRPTIYNWDPYLETYLPTTGGTPGANDLMSFSFDGKPLKEGDSLGL